MRRFFEGHTAIPKPVRCSAEREPSAGETRTTLGKVSLGADDEAEPCSKDGPIQAPKSTDPLKNALVIAAHPDDAELMVGGLIALLADSGFGVSVAFFTTSPESPSARMRRQQAAREAAAILGNDILWVEDGKYDHVTDIPEPRCVWLIDELLKEQKPEIVITHAVSDSHCDHVQLGRCVISATRRSSALFLAFGPSEYRAPTGNSFVPNIFVDVSVYMERKIAAINCYNYNGAPYRRLCADEIASLNKANGLFCGAEYAETLQVIRQFGVPKELLGVPKSWRG